MWLFWYGGVPLIFSLLIMVIAAILMRREKTNSEFAAKLDRFRSFYAKVRPSDNVIQIIAGLLVIAFLIWGAMNAGLPD
jgi:hypothetical protein